MKTTLIVLLTLILALGAGCSPSGPIGDPPLLETAVPTTQLVPSESTAPGSTEAAPAATATGAALAATPQPEVDLLGLPQVEQAIADLAQRLSIAPEDIQVMAAEMRTWSDASLGCPQPDMSYAQVPQDGLLVQLGYAGRVYNYHSGGNQAPFLCDPPLTDAKTTPVFGEDILTSQAP